MTAVRLGIVGAGAAYERVHRPFLEARPDRFQAVAVYDPDPSRGLNAASRTNAAAYESLDDLLSNRQVEAALVSTTPATGRFEIIRRALNAGLHVIAERPMAASAVQCDQLIELSRRKGVLLTACHFHRWDHAIVHARSRIQGGEVGEAILVKLAAAAEDGPLGGGLELFDCALLFNTSALSEVTAVPNLGRDGAPNTFTTLCRFERTPAVEITAFPVFGEGSVALPRIAVIGTRAMFADTSAPAAPDPQPFYDGVWSAIRERGAPPVLPASARNAVYLAECALDSAKQGRAVRADRLIKAVE
jgi:hypothetical protein